MPAIQIYLTSWCPYCQMALRLLSSKGQQWDAVDVEAEPERRHEMIQRAGRTSVPQIWIGERHIGGYDELAALDRAGELDLLLEAQPASSAAEAARARSEP